MNLEELKDLKEEYLYITYLIGAMEKPVEGDNGLEKRTEIEKELLLRRVFPINPVRLEVKKTGMTVEELKEKMNGWISSGNWEIFKKKANEIWKGKLCLTPDGQLVIIPGDIHYVIMSDWITFIFNEGDRCCGAFGETGISMEHNVPVYLVTDVIKRNLPRSLLQMVEVSNGEVFDSESAYLKFIDEKYHLKK